MNKTYPLFEKVRGDHDALVYIREQNQAMQALHYTEHSLPHVGIVTSRTAYILEALDFDEHTVDLALTAAWLHDIGNIVNRVDHSQSGALMAFHIMNRLGFSAEDIAPIIAAIGNHDEGYGVPVSPMSAALILADKSDVRRSRVQEPDESDYDIHDRVTFSVTESSLSIDREAHSISLELTIDTALSGVGDYFEIFMDRMRLCRRAAETLGLTFHLVINGQIMM